MSPFEVTVAAQPLPRHHPSQAALLLGLAACGVPRPLATFHRAFRHDPTRAAGGRHQRHLEVRIADPIGTTAACRRARAIDASRSPRRVLLTDSNDRIERVWPKRKTTRGKPLQTELDCGSSSTVRARPPGCPVGKKTCSSASRRTARGEHSTRFDDASDVRASAYRTS